MAKLVAVFCAFLLAGALAAPVAEETSPLPDAKELIEKADPVENDISAPRTDLPPEEATSTKEQTQNTETTNENEEKIENTQEQKEIPTDAKVNEKAAEATPVEATPSEDETQDVATFNENDTVEGGPYEGLVPVDEVIPPPEVAFVLGEYADSPSPIDATNYQVVQGETEEGMPVLSKYAPQEVMEGEEFEDTALPIAEATVHDYPPDEIIPEADFNEEVNGEMPEDPSLAPDMVPEGMMDYEEPLEDSDVPEEGMEEFHPDYDYPVDSTFVGPLHYPSDFTPGFSDDSDNQDPPVDEFMTGPVMNVDLPPVQYPDMPNMEDSFANQEEHDVTPTFGNIVAGLEARYHPDPISGFNSQGDERHFDGPEVNYQVYNDQPIIPGAMLNTNSPVAEGMHSVDTPVPERVPMDDLSDANAMMSMDDMSETKFVDTNAVVAVPNDLDMNENQGFELDRPMSNPDFDDKPDIVIELSLNNQEAAVNGRPFDMSQADTILNFIEELISRATFSKRPMMDDTNDQFNTFNTEPEYPTPDMPVNDFTTRYTPPLYSRRLPFYGDMGVFDNSYYPVKNEFDYNPYNPFFNPLFNRGMSPAFEMPGNIYDNRLGFETPSRERRFAYNPVWF